MSDSTNNVLTDLGEFAEEAYLAYAMSTVTARAIPSLADGQKPVQRRILFAMREMGLLKSPKHVKSARVVGDVLGKWHPHGDSSVYDAMVRMAQNFTLRYPVVDGQGNFGSLDGDSAAAMRYTEARLLPISDLLLSEIDEDTVDFQRNYDGTLEEPALLPARLPFLLLNGASGIAVGMATEIPSHNLREVGETAARLVLNPNLSDDDILSGIPGPDFPGGGQIISSPEVIRQAYLTGRGSVRVRASWAVETFAKKEWQLVITELPPGVSTASVLTEIESKSNPALKLGKKTLTPEQITLKNAFLSQIDQVRDESGKAYAVRLIITPKSKNQDPEELARFLLARTSLETNASLNLTLIDTAGKSPCLGVPAILRQWAEFRIQTVRRRTAFRLAKAEARIHILEGRMKILLDIDSVIRVIRESDDPKQDLMEAFSLSEIQAEDILEIRLRQLARLAGLEIEKELNKLQKEASKLRALLDKESLLRKTVAQEIQADTETYADPRRTRLEADERISESAVPVVSDAPVTLTVSRKGWLKSRTGHSQDTGNLAFKDGDALLASFAVKQNDALVLLDSAGRAYSLPAALIPGGKGEGVPASSQLDIQKNPIQAALAGAPDSFWLVAGSGGYGFLTQLDNLTGRNKIGKAFLSVTEGETLLPPLRVPLSPEDWATTQIILVSEKGKVLVIPLSEVKELPKGKGVKLISLDENDRLLDWDILGESAAFGYPPEKLRTCLGSRGGKGKKLRKA